MGAAGRQRARHAQVLAFLRLDSPVVRFVILSLRDGVLECSKIMKKLGDDTGSDNLRELLICQP